MRAPVRVLVVDDEEDVRLVTVNFLRSAGYQVLEAGDGRECLEILAGERCDIVLLDVVLPDEDGRDVCRRIKTDARFGHPLIILMSGLLTSSEDHADALEVGADLFLPKPIEKRVILAQVSAMVRLKRAEEAIRVAYEEVAHRVRQRTVELAKSNESLRTEIEARKNAEIALHDRLQFERLVADLSAKFINISRDRFDAELEEWLRRIVDCLGIDRSTLVRWTKGGRCLQAVRSYAVPGVSPYPGSDIRAHLPWYAGMVERGETLIFERLPDDLPGEAVSERDYCRETGIKSQLTVPLRAGEHLFGALGFATFRDYRRWPKELVDRLQIPADIFANSLMRIETEEELQEKTRSLLEAQRIAHMGNWQWDIPANQLHWSDEIYRIFGLSPKEFGATYEAFLDAVHDEDREFVKASVTRSLADSNTPYGVEHRVVRPDGSVRAVHERAEVTRNAAGEPVRMVGTVQDITDLKRAQEELRRSEERFRAIADYGYDWEIWTAPDGALAWTNPAVERVTGYTAEEYRNLPERLQIFSVENEQESFRSFFGRTIREGITANDIPIRVRHKDGTVRMVSASYQPIFGDDGRYLGIRASLRDVTDRRRVEMEAQKLREELARVTRASTMGELAASLAHQLNQPLAAILSNAQAALRFLREDDPDIEEVRDALADIAEDDRRAGEVIRKLRALYRKRDIECVPLDMNNVVREVVSLLRGQAILSHVSIDLCLGDGLPLVPGDRIQLQQVVMNLIVNGMDAMKERPAGSRRLEVSTEATGDALVRVAVRDTGNGIDAETLEKIFEPFYSTKAGGMGMGLSISRSIIESHGGSIKAENHPDGGAIFSFVLEANDSGDRA